MKKLQFKKILNILDSIELQGITLEETPLRVYEALANDYYAMKLSEVKDVIHFLNQKRLLSVTANGIDLCPAPTVYAKSNQNSGVEALAIFESFIHNESIYAFYQMQIHDNIYRSRSEIATYLDNNTLQLMLPSILFETADNNLRFHPKLLKGIRDILREYEKRQPLLSTMLAALYTSGIVAHEDMRIDYKNSNLPIINYPYKDIIMSILPRRGIPHDRDETKALQSFYKDTLFHEFQHACPLCGITIPHMLIASHIKPFRDCAHIFEAVDHNNGLLLCRNHDYLFDQGYFTFDETGSILLSKELLSKENMEKTYVIDTHYRLPQQYLSPERLLFLKYHKEYIFRQDR